MLYGLYTLEKGLAIDWIYQQLVMVQSIDGWSFLDDFLGRYLSTYFANLMVSKNQPGQTKSARCWMRTERKNSLESQIIFTSNTVNSGFNSTKPIVVIEACLTSQLKLVLVWYKAETWIQKVYLSV